MKAVLADKAQITTAAAGSAPVFADARRSFAAKIDAVTLQEQADGIIALRDLRTRLLGDLDARQM